METVTAIITTFERDTSIVERAIKSVVKQTYPVQEILVVDDNQNLSPLSKKIEALCSEYSMCRYIKQDGNRGSCAARNLGIKKAKEKYIGFLDDDDQWLPDKTEAQIKAFKESNDDPGMIFCSGIQMDEETGIKTDYYNFNMKKEVSFEDELGCDYIGSTSNPLIKKECFHRVGGFWESLPARQDYEMWLRISKRYRIKGIEGKYFIYNIHAGEQITKDKNKSYIGFKNIYMRYKKDYVKNPEARVNILNWIIWNKPGITAETIGFWTERESLKLKLKLNLNYLR